MADTFHEFDRRYRSITKKHRRLAGGYVTKLNANGVIEHQPLRKGRAFSLRAFGFVIATFFILKAYLLAGLGLQSYTGTVVDLAKGNPLEKIGAWMMQIDPLTLWLAQSFKGLGL